jgi:RNA polymerase sigma-70 factor (ECF subfamily)
MRGERERVNVSVSVSVAKIVDQGYPLRSSPAPMRKFLPVHLSSPLESALDQHRARLLRYVVSIIRDRGDAEDLLQEILLRAHRGFANLRAGEAVTTWLFRIATHACVDHFRQRARQPAIDADADPDVLAPSDAATSTLQATIERREMSACVQRLLEALPDDYCSVLMLIELEGLSGLETAGLLGVPLTTVKMRLHRARRMLQTALEEGCSFGCDERGVIVCEPKN